MIGDTGTPCPRPPLPPPPQTDTSCIVDCSCTAPYAQQLRLTADAKKLFYTQVEHKSIEMMYSVVA